LFNLLASARSSWGWGGCVESPPYPQNVNDVTPQPSNAESLIEPMFTPDEPDASYTTSYYDSRGRLRTQSVSDPYTYSNDYIDDHGSCTGGQPTGSTNADEITKQSRLCKYRNPTITNTSSGYGPNSLCTTQSLLRMQTSSANLLTKINAMSPNGWTNIHEGFMWGWRTISPNGPFAEGRPYTESTNVKVIVLMTDGANTWNDEANQINKSDYSAYGYYTSANGRLPPGNQNLTDEIMARAAMDQLTLEACANARAAGVVIFTIGFSGTYDPIDAQGQNLLSACAADPTRVFLTSTSSGLQSAFTQIGNQIGKLRLSK
jgi:hypothetical protein